MRPPRPRARKTTQTRAIHPEDSSRGDVREGFSLFLYRGGLIRSVLQSGERARSGTEDKKTRTGLGKKTVTAGKRAARAINIIN